MNQCYERYSLSKLVQDEISNLYIPISNIKQVHKSSNKENCSLRGFNCMFQSNTEKQEKSCMIQILSLQFLRAKIIVLSDVIVNVNTQDINDNCHEKHKCKGKEVFFYILPPVVKHCF